jgi:hypothetical protein
MNSIARLIALPIVSAGIIGGAALGLAGMANAQSQAPTGPGHSYSPVVKAKPAPNQKPGWHSHHGPQHIAGLSQH